MQQESLQPPPWVIANTPDRLPQADASVRLTVGMEKRVGANEGSRLPLFARLRQEGRLPKLAEGTVQGKDGNNIGGCRLLLHLLLPQPFVPAG